MPDIVIPEATAASAWKPVEGAEFRHLVSSKTSLSKRERDNLALSSREILSKCVPPYAFEGTQTGLVMGLVQSGKTMSFTAVAAMARDNGYRLVIVITGTTEPLSKQSTDRLYKDLQIDSQPGIKWVFLKDPKAADRGKIEDRLANWGDSHKAENFRQTVVISVMKHWRHIDNLSEALEGIDLRGFSGLIVDDEADQASMNTKPRTNDQSSTYRAIMRLRSALPSHTYLQYTATPQAPLLISKIDALSPDFAAVLEPGQNYTGGYEFFSGNRRLLIEVDDTELPAAWTSLTPPPSLERALMQYFILVANQTLADPPERRSMMVHPDRTRTSHNTYARWIEGLKSSWDTFLKEEGQAKEELKSEFEACWKDMSATCELRDFDKIFERLPLALNLVTMVTVNSERGKTPQPDWHNSLFHILVGGQAMDRGFTVEGLAITYMPRGVGVGNADTIQQRARFFGYKKHYINECRVYLERNVIGAFTRYVEHEQDLRDRLISHINTGASLKEWKRHFFLSADLNPTRSNVISDDIYRTNFAGKWFTQDSPIAGGQEVVDNNMLAVAEIMDLEWEEMEGHAARTRDQVHSCAVVSLSDLYENFLIDYAMGDGTESLKYSSLLLQIKAYLAAKADAAAMIVRMSPSQGPRTRQIDARERVIKLHQGSNSNKRTGELIYPGDSKIFDPEIVTVQIHDLRLTDENGREVHPGVPTIAVRLPRAAGRDTLTQDG